MIGTLRIEASLVLQEEKLRELYAQHNGEKGYLAVIAEEMMGGFKKGQISSQLRKLGLRPDKGKKRKSQVSSVREGNTWPLGVP